MLSLLPTLLSYEQAAPFLLRVSLGIIFIYWAYKKLGAKKNSRETALGLVEGVLGILLIVGFLTQLAALIASAIFIIRLAVKAKDGAFFTDGVNYYFLLLVISLSLLVSGPGLFAFDLPL